MMVVFKQKEQDLLLAAHDLKSSAPEVWRSFTQALGGYASAKCIEAVQSPAEMALIAHGRAQALLALGETFEDLDARVDAIKKGRMRQNRP